MSTATPAPEGRWFTGLEVLAELEANPYIPEIDGNPDEPSDGAIAEQRHQFLDLDPDSAHTIPGATCPNCPPGGGRRG